MDNFFQELLVCEGDGRVRVLCRLLGEEERLVGVAPLDPGVDRRRGVKAGRQDRSGQRTSQD